MNRFAYTSHLKALCLLCLSCLCACLEVTEEYWILEDGRGRLRADMAFLSTPEQSEEIRQKVRKLQVEMKDSMFVDNFTFEDSIHGGLHHFVIDITVSHFRHLTQVHEALVQARSEMVTEGTPPAETLEFSLNRNLSHTLVKTLPVGLAPGNSQNHDKDAISHLMEQELKKRFFTVILHASDITKHNGTDADNNTVTWQVSMAEVLGEKPGTHSFEATAKAPLGAYGLWAFFAACVPVAFSVFWLKKRNTK